MNSDYVKATVELVTSLNSNWIHEQADRKEIRPFSSFLPFGDDDNRKRCPPGWIGKRWPFCDRPIFCPIFGFCPPIQIPIPIGNPEQCPPGTTGTPPDCIITETTEECPPGTTGTPPDCIITETTEECPPGTTGTPPDCTPIEPPICPEGTTGTPPNCGTPPEELLPTPPPTEEQLPFDEQPPPEDEGPPETQENEGDGGDEGDTGGDEGDT